MTQQPYDYFEHQDSQYILLGISKGELPTINDLDVDLPKDHIHVGSTGFRYGFIAYYGIGSDAHLIIKKVEIPEVVIKFPNQRLSNTCHILFANVGAISPLFDKETELENLQFFEAEVVEGKVVEVKNISERVAENLQDLLPTGWIPSWVDGNYESQLKQVEQQWDLVSKLFSKKYEVLRVGQDYFSYTEYIDYLRQKLR